MTTYSVRCRHDACRHRRVTRTHPDEYKVVPKCPVCGNRKGWRIEGRQYNKRGLCHCSGPDMSATGAGQHFPHRTTHPLCDQHPHGFYNQARAQDVAHEDIPKEYHPMKTTERYQAAAAGEALVNVCHGASERAGWWYYENGGGSVNLKQEAQIGSRFGKALVAEKLALIHSEISEGMEGHRKNKMDDHLPHRPMLEVELADAMIRIADLAGALGLDLGGAIAEKLAYNAERADHKPENRNAAGGKAY